MRLKPVMKTGRLKSLSVSWDQTKTNGPVGRPRVLLIIWRTNLEDKSRLSVNLTWPYGRAVGGAFYGSAGKTVVCVSAAVVSRDYTAAAGACRGLQGYAVEGSVCFVASVLVKG